MDAKLSKRRTARTGFTLVELLVVVAIIALLASLVIVGGAAAWRAARRAIITGEIRQMQEQLDIYHTNCGNDYPPDCAGGATSTAVQQDILRHFEKRFSKYRPGSWAALKADIAVDYPDFDIEKLDPTSAFAFFLGGMPDGGKPTGFSADPRNPFKKSGSRIDPMFEFDETRYEVIGGVPVYFPQYIENPNNSERVPYVYFRARGGGYSGSVDTGSGTCGPYKKGSDWCQPKGFQIITAGLDGEFGGSQDITSLKPADDDNLTSFAPGQLKDAADAE